VAYQDGELVKTCLLQEAVRPAAEFWISPSRSIELFVGGGRRGGLFNVPTTGEHLQRRRQILTTLTSNRIGGSRLTGIDSLNGVAYACEKMDAAMGTHYSDNMKAYRAWCKKNDPSLCAAVSDPKGNRRLHAEDPNRPTRISVSGWRQNKEGTPCHCKLHQRFYSIQ
jgi:aromatic ring hydroxylase